MIETERLLQAAIGRDWAELSAETRLSPTRLTQMALTAIDTPEVIAQHPAECRILAARREKARQNRGSH